MCGLFGFSGKKQVDEYKFKILGLFNDSRGGDSTGIFFNGCEIEKDLGDAFKFFRTIGFNKDVEFKDRVVFGHTRKSSSGAKTKVNAHPFKYVKDEEFKSAFAHNGTLNGWKHDMSKFINPEKIKDITVDSQALGLLITNKHYGFLEEYDGAVTYLYYDTAEKNTLQIFKGATLDYQNKQSADRPMFALRTKEGVYFSSLKEALEAIEEEDDEYIDIPVNEILFYKDGELTKSIKINRNKSYYDSVNYTNVSNSNNWNNRNLNNVTRYPLEKKANVSEKKESDRRFWNNTIDYSINVFRGRVYFNRGRYYRNGHLMHSFVSDGKGNTSIIPYNLTNEGSIIYGKDVHLKGYIYYFYKGLILNIKVEEDKKEILKKYRILNILFKHAKKVDSSMLFKISSYSKYISKFVIGHFAFLNSELSISVPRFCVYKDGKLPIYESNKIRCVFVKFARNINLYLSGDFHACEISDFNKCEDDYRVLSKIVQKKNSENALIVEQSHKDFYEVNNLKIKSISDLFLDSLYERLIYKNMINEEQTEELDEKSEFTNDELRLIADLDILKNDAELLYGRLENGEYKEVSDETLNELKASFTIFINDSQNILELIG